MTSLFEKLLQQRGLTTDFLHPKYEDLPDPMLFKGMPEAVTRIELACEKGEQVAIYGDYDADGITASTVLKTALNDFGCKAVEVLLPDRFRDGFGLKMSAIERIEASRATLVITVDNGSSAGEVVRELKARGIDTIVTDHHEITEVSQDAIAVINPKRSDEQYGDGLAGVGVAFMLARALNARKNGGVCDGREKWLLDLVTIGTICDAMELKGDNRILTYWGMRVLAKTRRIGLRELMQQAGVRPDRIDSHVIGFQIGPRLNVAGRLETAELSFELLNTDSRAEAKRLAMRLNELNGERRDMQVSIEDESGENLDASDKVIVVAGQWHEGVVGIVAGRLTEKYKKPAFVFARLEDGILKGSGRSFGEFELVKALEQCKDLLISGGGHAGACGASLKEENLEEFRKRINEYYLSLGLKDQERFLARQTDLAIESFEGLDEELFDEIASLEPFGDGNEEPLFEIRGQICDVRVLKKRHLSLLMSDGGYRMRMLAFNAPKEWLELSSGEQVKVQFLLTKNEWNGMARIEGQITDITKSNLEDIKNIC